MFYFLTAFNQIVQFSGFKGKIYEISCITIPLICKDGDDVINNVTCVLKGTGSISVHRVYMGNMDLNRIKRLKSFTNIALTYDLTLLNTHIIICYLFKKYFDYYKVKTGESG